MKRNKQMLALILVTLQLTMTVPMVTWAGTTENLLQNGGFEEASSVGWTLSGGATWDQIYTYSGKQSVKLTTVNMETESVFQVIPVEAGAQYRISAWMLADYAKAEKGFVYAYTFYKKEGDVLQNIGASASSTYFGYESPTIWTECAGTFTAPPGAQYAGIRMNLYANGTVYVDDATVQKIKDVPHMLVETDAVFYYTDAENGKVTVHYNRQAYSDFSGFQIAFSVKDGNTVINATAKQDFTDGLTYTFPLSALAEAKKYTLNVSLYKADGTLLQDETESIYKYKRPGYITPEGRFIKNGKEITPVIGYGMGWPDAEANISATAQMGVNVIMSNTSVNLDEMEDMLDLAWKYNTYVILALYRNMLPAGHPLREQVTKSAVTKFQSHPALFGYAMLDEPFAGKTVEDGKAWLENGYKIIRNIDKNHPVYLCECPEYKKNDALPVSWRYELAAKYADCLAIDPYPAGVYNDVEFVAEQVTDARKAVRGQKPVYAILQAFTWKNNTPSNDALKNGIYQAYFAGAGGIGYYRFANPLGDGVPLQDTKYADIVQNFWKNEQPILDACFIQKTNSLLDNGETSEYRYAIFKENENIYIALASKNITESVDVAISVPQPYANGYTAVRISDSDEKPSSCDAEFYTTLQKAEAVLFRLTPEKSVCTFRDGKGQAVSKIENGGIYCATYHYVNETDTIQTVQMLLAVYITANNAKKELLSLVPIEAQAVCAHKTADFTGTVSIPDFNSNQKYSITAFLWQDMRKPMVRKSSV